MRMLGGSKMRLAKCFWEEVMMGICYIVSLVAVWIFVQKGLIHRCFVKVQWFSCCLGQNQHESTTIKPTSPTSISCLDSASDEHSIKEMSLTGLSCGHLQFHCFVDFVVTIATYSHIATTFFRTISWSAEVFRLWLQGQQAFGHSRVPLLFEGGCLGPNLDVEVICMSPKGWFTRGNSFI